MYRTRVLVVLLFVVACEASAPRTEPSVGAPPAAVGRLRRLTAVELENTLSDLFLAGAPFSAAFPREAPAGTSDALGVPPVVAEALRRAAERVATLAVQRLPLLIPCSPARDGERACAAQAVDRLATQAWRRPPTPAQRERLLRVFDDARAVSEFPGAVGAVIEALVQSPHFLFRSELGAAAPAGVVVSLDRHELASALSYFLWGSAPDRALEQAASAGRLGTRAGLEAEAQRLLQDARARRALQTFVLRWLEVDAPAVKDPRAIAGWTPEIAAKLIVEARRFVDDVLWRDDGRLQTLLSAPLAFVDAGLARVYGVEDQRGDAQDDDEWRAVRLDDQRRAGVLTLPAFLAAHTPAAGFSPVRLGRFVRGKLLCQPVPPPPPEVPPLPAAVAATGTRQRFAAHTAAPACSGCHALLDPIGFGFETLDALGRPRDREGDLPLTGAGHLSATDVDGAFVGAAALSRRLSGSEQVAACFAAQMLSFAVGRDVVDPARRTAADVRALADGVAALRRTDGDVRALAVALAGSDAFRLRVAPEVAP